MVDSVVARQLLAEAERRGLRFRVFDDRLEATPKLSDRLLYAAIAECKAEIIALLRERNRSREMDEVIFAQALLRQGYFPAAPGPCAYHCGYVQEPCRRCRYVYAEHNESSL